MSWDGYVVNMEKEGCKYVGFFDFNGNKWAETKSPVLHITADQIQHIVRGIKSPNTVDLRAQGAKLGGHKFICLNVEERIAVLKQLSGNSNEKLMVCIGCFNKGCVIGAALAGEREKCCRLSVEKCVEYLRANKY